MTYTRIGVVTGANKVYAAPRNMEV
jgi:hypothetical protein